MQAGSVYKFPEGFVNVKLQNKSLPHIIYAWLLFESLGVRFIFRSDSQVAKHPQAFQLWCKQVSSLSGPHFNEQLVKVNCQQQSMQVVI